MRKLFLAIIILGNFTITNLHLYAQHSEPKEV